MPRSHSQNRRLRLRSLANQGILLWVLWLLIGTWCLEGLFTPLQISGPSMAPALCGPRRELPCQDCGFLLACDATRPPISPRAVCPNCGFPQNNLAGRPVLTGDRILIDRATFNFRLPRRWEVIAFRPPGEAEIIAVKRVVGLPGETVKILHGDVWVNGRIAQKSLGQQKAMLVPVYDARFPPQSNLPPRWSARSPDSRWNWQGDRFECPCSAAAGTTAKKSPQTLVVVPGADERNELDPHSPSIDWLVYRHWRRKTGVEGVQFEPVNDVLPYNQNHPYREENVHSVADLFLTFRVVAVSGSGAFWVRAGDGRDTVQVGIGQQQKQLCLYQNGQQKTVQELPMTPWTGMEIEVTLIDRQFLLAFGGQIVCRLPLESRPDPPPGTPEPFAVGSDNLGIVLDSLRIFRDVCYAEPLANTRVQGNNFHSVLGKNEFFVLGDNSAVSQDSRNESTNSAIEERHLIGKPLIAVGRSKAL